MKELRDRNRQVVIMRRDEGKSAIAIGRELGISRERARQIVHDTEARLAREASPDAPDLAVLESRVQTILIKAGLTTAAALYRATDGELRSLFGISDARLQTIRTHFPYTPEPIR